MIVLIKLLYPFYRRYWGLFLVGILAVAAVNALALLPGWTTGRVVDLLWTAQKAPSLGKPLWTIGGYLALLWGLALLRALLMVAMRLTLVVLSRRAERDHRAFLTRHLMELDLNTLRAYPIGELMTYFTEDLNRLRNFTGPVILYGLQVFFLTLFTASLMLLTHVKLALLSLLPLFLLIPLSYFLRREALRRGHEQQAAYAYLSAFLQQVYPFLRPLRAIAQSAALLTEWNKRSLRHMQASLTVASVEGYLQPLTTLFVGISLTLVIIYGGIAVVEGEISLGTVSAFSLYILQLMFPLGALGWLISLTQQARASAERLLSLQNLPPQVHYPTVSIHIPQSPTWEWKQLGYAYHPNEWVFRNLTGMIPAGAKVALSMPMGSGKSTFARLLARQMDPTEGHILFGGSPLAGLSRADLRSWIAYVPQQPVLFSGTIIENLRLVRPEASFREIWQALEWAGLAEEVQSLPKEIHTDIGIWGQQVSGGQRQRLALAMALLRKPQALILDETFAPLDSAKIEEILFHLRRHLAEATWLLITHRQEVKPYVESWVVELQALSWKGSEIGAR